MPQGNGSKDVKEIELIESGKAEDIQYRFVKWDLKDTDQKSDIEDFIGISNVAGLDKAIDKRIDLINSRRKKAGREPIAEDKILPLKHRLLMSHCCNRILDPDNVDKPHEIAKLYSDYRKNILGISDPISHDEIKPLKEIYKDRVILFPEYNLANTHMSKRFL